MLVRYARARKGKATCFERGRYRWDAGYYPEGVDPFERVLDYR